MLCKSIRCYLYHYCDSELTGNAESKHTLSKESEIPLVSTADRQPDLDVTSLQKASLLFLSDIFFLSFG